MKEKFLRALGTLYNMAIDNTKGSRAVEICVNDIQNYVQQKENIIKEVREYITSYESIETIQQFDHNKNNKDLDYSTIDEMTRRYMIVHDKLLEIIDRS